MKKSFFFALRNKQSIHNLIYNSIFSPYNVNEVVTSTIAAATLMINKHNKVDEWEAIDN